LKSNAFTILLSSLVNCLIDKGLLGILQNYSISGGYISSYFAARYKHDATMFWTSCLEICLGWLLLEEFEE
jgi:hypothetical protein